MYEFIYYNKYYTYFKELAQKTKELAQTGKKQSVPDREKNQDVNSKVL